MPLQAWRKEGGPSQSLPSWHLIGRFRFAWAPLVARGAGDQAAYPGVLPSYQKWSSRRGIKKNRSWGGTGSVCCSVLLPVIRQTCARIANSFLCWPWRNRLGKNIFALCFSACFSVSLAGLKVIVLFYDSFLLPERL